MSNPKKRRFGHSERELWAINYVGCPFFANVNCNGHYICTNKWNRQARKHSICKYELCPMKQAVAYEDYDTEETDEEI